MTRTSWFHGRIRWEVIRTKRGVIRTRREVIRTKRGVIRTRREVIRTKRGVIRTRREVIRTSLFPGIWSHGRDEESGWVSEYPAPQ